MQSPPRQYTLLLLTFVFFILTACGGAATPAAAPTIATDALADPAEATEAPTDTEETDASAEGAYPVTIEHKFGSTTIESAPQRIVVLGFTEQDFYYALGAQPIAIRYWYGDEADAIFPWADAAAGDAAPEVLNMTWGSLDYETLVGLNPDLISAIGAGINQDEYDRLSQIAPTIAQSDAYIDYGTPWQETTTTIGKVVGKEAEAEALVAGVQDQIEAIRKAHPEFEGKTIAVVYSFTPGSFGFYTAGDQRGRFFTDLGFVVPDELVELAGDSFYADVSQERLDILDQDLIVVLNAGTAEGGQERIESEALFSQLDAVKEGRVVYIPAEYEDAVNFNTVLSIPYSVENLVPLLSDALTGQ